MALQDNQSRMEDDAWMEDTETDELDDGMTSDETDDTALSAAISKLFAEKKIELDPAELMAAVDSLIETRKDDFADNPFDPRLSKEEIEELLALS